MFHVSGGLFFKREENGSVTIIKTDGKHPDEGGFVLFHQTMDDATWGSVISSLSAGGEQDYRWYAAMDFHKSTGEITVARREYEAPVNAEGG